MVYLVFIKRLKLQAFQAAISSFRTSTAPLSHFRALHEMHTALLPQKSKKQGTGEGEVGMGHSWGAARSSHCFRSLPLSEDMHRTPTCKRTLERDFFIGFLFCFRLRFFSLRHKVLRENLRSFYCGGERLWLAETQEKERVGWEVPAITAVLNFGQSTNIKKFALKKLWGTLIIRRHRHYSWCPFSSIKNWSLALLACCWRKSISAASNPEAVSQQFSVQVLINSGPVTEHTLRKNGCKFFSYYWKK